MLRAALVAVALAAISVTATAAPAGAWQPAQEGTSGAPSTSATPPTSSTSPAPATLPTKGEGIYSAPEWLPLRHDLNGGEIKVGCTHQSRGSQHAYECGGHHRYWAIDFVATRGTPVYAAGSGFARNATGQSGSSGYGSVVRIDHGFGVESLYAHLDRVLLPPEGAWVDADTVIGVVGNTGGSSTPHLHFEKRVDGAVGQENTVDPGPLKACVWAHVVTYPQVRNEPTWDHLPWGAVSVFSDGSTCDEPAPLPGTAAAAETTPAPTDNAPAATAATGEPAVATGSALADQLPSGWLLMALADLGRGL